MGPRTRAVTGDVRAPEASHTKTSMKRYLSLSKARRTSNAYPTNHGGYSKGWRRFSLLEIFIATDSTCNPHSGHLVDATLPLLLTVSNLERATV